MGDFHLLSDQKERFEEGHLDLDPGDKLFVYTDGITEYISPDGELYGMQRFCEMLESLQARSVHDIVEKAIQSLKNFSHNAKPDDDITLLGLELNNIAIGS